MEDRQSHILVQLRHQACRKRQRGEGLEGSSGAPLLGHEDAVAGQDLHDLGVTVEVVEEGAALVSVAGEAASAYLDPGLVQRHPDGPHAHAQLLSYHLHGHAANKRRET